MNPALPDNPIQIPDHELLKRVGQGSYGEVWLARNVMGTFRAIKIIRRDTFDHDRPFEREFEGIRQFEPISRLHAGLTAILHIGRGQNCFYYVMEVADDLEQGKQIAPDHFVPRTLSAELSRKQRLAARQCAQLGRALADALSCLHGQGLVHRDIKPSNIIFVDGSPKLADVGLVAEANEKASFVGTAGYIPPEGPGTAAADLFSLGKVLYEASMGKDREEFPALPTALRELPEAPALLRLNAIITKACQPDSRRRFASAGEMALALARLAEELGEDQSTVTETGAGPRKTACKLCVVLNTGEDAWVESMIQRLADRLAGTGIHFHIDKQRQITREGARDLEKRIARAQVLLVVLSETTLKSELLAYSLGLAAQSMSAQENRPKIIAIRRNETGALPRLVSLLMEGNTVLEWNHAHDEERVIEELRQVLMELAPG